MNDNSITESWQEQLDRENRQRNSPYGPDGADVRLVPNPDLPLGETSVYQTVSITSLAQETRAPRELTEPLDLLGTERRAAHGPAEGVILTHEQAWRQKGVTLGKLLHSLSLAPGEVTQIAVTTWHRTSRGESAEDVDERERAVQEAGQQREIHDITRAVGNETTFGSSTSNTLSTQVDAGGGFLGFSAGASHNSSVATSANFNTGARNLSADSNNAVRQATQQHASNVRGRRAALVQEMSESETEQFQTRVVANYNHTHTLNMMYYEVLQVYELSTLITDAQRCIFIPMQEVLFDETNVVGFSRQLATAARQMGREGLAHAIETIKHEEQRINAEILLKERELKELKSIEKVTKLDELKAAAARLEGQISELHQQQRIERSQSVLLAIGELDSYDRTERLESEYSAHRYSLQGQIDEEERHITRLENELRVLKESQQHMADDVIRQLNDQQLLFNQALWAQLDPTQVATMLRGKRHGGVSLPETVDPNPVAVIGNYVGFRWNFPDRQAEAARAFRERHLHDDVLATTVRDTVVLPTGGVFAEAVPGRANSAEKLDLRRFWKWDENTIPILPTAIANLHQQRRARRAEAKPGSLGASAVSLQQLPAFPAPPAHQLAAIVGTSVFRDMSGSDVILPLLQAAQQTTGQTAQDMQKLAHDNIKAFLDHVEQLAPQIGDLLKKQATPGATVNPNSEEGGIGPSELGGLQNALGEAGEGLDVGALLGDAAELAMFL